MKLSFDALSTLLNLVIGYLDIFPSLSLVMGSLEAEISDQENRMELAQYCFYQQIAESSPC